MNESDNLDAETMQSYVARSKEMSWNFRKSDRDQIKFIVHSFVVVSTVRPTRPNETSFAIHYLS